jgi:uncharacterized protein YqgC (DUF456 family)
MAISGNNNRSNPSNSQPPNNNNDDSKKTSNPLVKLISNTAYGAVGGATSVALTALPFVNKYIGVANTGMLPKAIGYGAMSGAIVGTLMPLENLLTITAATTGLLGTLTASNIASFLGANDEQIRLRSEEGAAIGMICGSVAGIALTGFATGYFAKELAPNVFKESAVKTGIKLIGTHFVHFVLREKN